MKAYFITALFFINAATASIPNPINQLSEKFVTSYQEAVTQTKYRIRACPLITQDLLAMTLHTSSGVQKRFVMKKEVYKISAEIAHIPLTIHNIISKYDWAFHEASQKELNDYEQLLEAIAPSLEQSIPDEALKQAFRQIISLSRNYLDSIMSQQSIDKEQFLQYASAIRPLTEYYLYEGAKIQLQQFHKQFLQWRKQYPEEQWSCLKIAILGTHGPRTGYVLKQYFQMLLKEPQYEKEVIYVEFPDISDIFSDKNKSISLAINAIMNNSYQLELGNNVMNNPAYLQEDVMAKAGSDILKTMREKGEMDYR